MSRRFDLLVFDWDGTLVDSAGHIVASIQAACQDLGLQVPSEEAARYIIGLGLHDSLSYLLPELDPSRYRSVAERYSYHFLLRDPHIRLFSGVEEGIRGLNAQGFLLAIATGKSRRGLDRALAATGLREYFHGSRCADEGFSKPHPGMLLGIMDELSADPRRTLMIGDTTHDLDMARNATVSSVAVAYGAHPRADLTSRAPLACVDSFADLQSWLASNA